MNRKKQDIKNWLEKLEQYAKENQFSARIIDGIQSCRKDMGNRKCTEEQIEAEIEELLQSIQKKISPQAIVREEPDTTVTTDMIAAKMEKMVKRCQEENRETV